MVSPDSPWTSEDTQKHPRTHVSRMITMCPWPPGHMGPRTVEYIVRGAGRSERGAMWVTAALTEPTDTTAAAAAAANETPMPS